MDTDRNAVSLTTTVNSYFGARVLSSSTGILLNNEMDDFSTPAETTPDHLPPAPANFIEPNKRPLSSMAPIIVLKVLYYQNHLYEQRFCTVKFQSSLTWICSYTHLKLNLGIWLSYMVCIHSLMIPTDHTEEDFQTSNS